MFNEDEPRPWHVAIYRDGKMIMGDSYDCYERALMYPSLVSAPLMPTDVIKIDHVSGRRRQAHYWFDHAEVERRYFSS